MNCTRKAGPPRPKAGSALRRRLVIAALVDGLLLLEVPSKAAVEPAVASFAPIRASQLVTNLTRLRLTTAPMSVAQAAWLKQQLAELSALGTNALPAIQGFLDRNADVYFDAPGNAELAGAPSLRVALLELVGNLRAPEAVVLLKSIFQSTADPAELATLAKLLDRAEPGKHQVEFLAAARETLAVAASDKWDGRDVAPLFEILKKFGGAAAPVELERFASHWPDYTAITLLELPDRIGLPLLIKLAQNADDRLKSGRESFQRTLAEAALKHPAAKQSLLDQARVGKIAVTAWPGVAAALIGNTWRLARPVLESPLPLVARPNSRVHRLATGHQVILEVPPPDNLPAQDMGERIRCIDQLLEATTEPAALDALEGARIQLSEKLSRAK